MSVRNKDGFLHRDFHILSVAKYESLIASRIKTVTMLFGIKRGTVRDHEYFGTGFYVSFEGKVFIVTALHVAKRMEGYSYCFHSANQKTFPVMGGFVGCPVPQADWAIIGCFHGCLSQIDIPIDFCNLKPHYQNIGDHCLITGCPEKQLLQIPVTREASVKLNSVVTEIIGISPDAKHIYLGYGKSIVEPPGMSGSPMWKITYSSNGSVLEEEFFLSGIVTRWLSKDEQVVATNGQVFFSYFEQMARKFTKLFPRGDMGSNLDY